MCKLFLISLILTSSLSLSFSTNNSNCEETELFYELKLKKNDPDVIKFAEDGWKELVAKGKTRGVTEKSGYSVKCAKVKSAEFGRIYTIVVVYATNSPENALSCVIFVTKIQSELLFIRCLTRDMPGYVDPVKREQRDMFSLFNNSHFCPE